MPEQRQIPRKNSFVGGQIVSGDQKPMFCLVRDISDQGAKLELSDAANVPDEFSLRVNGSEGLYRAKVIWRRDHDLGVAFEAVRPTSAAALPRAS